MESGPYTGGVSDVELRRITVDYTIKFARIFRSSSPNAAFSFLSGNGADPSGRSRMPFARYKGAAENAPLAADFPHVLHLPARVYPIQPRKERISATASLRAIYPAFRVLFPKELIRTDDLALGGKLGGSDGTRARGLLRDRRSNQLNYAPALRLLVLIYCIRCPPVPCRAIWPCRDRG